MLAQGVSTGELKRQDFVRGIANYRPSNTIFEQGKHQVDAGRQMMDLKRRKHGGLCVRVPLPLNRDRVQGRGSRAG